MKSLTQHRWGFTLIELLVVIAIIAVLAAILFPVFARAREKARQTTCSSNQRQLVVAVQMYTQDHGETIFADPTDKAWTSNLSVENIYRCPSKSGSGSQGAPDYGFNTTLYGAPLTEISAPSEVLLTADLTPSSTVAQKTSAFGNIDTDIDPRHSGGFLLTCVDGHVTFASAKGQTNTLALMNAGILTFACRIALADRRPLIAIGGEDKWHDAGFTFTLPDGCYRKTATDPCPSIAVEWDMNRLPINNNFTGAEFMFATLGIFCADSEIGHYAAPNGLPSASVTAGYYMGLKCYAGANADANDNGWTGLYSKGSHYFAQASDTNTLISSPAAKIIADPLRTYSYYHLRAIFTADGKCYLTATDTTNGKVLGTTVNTLNLANDCAPGNNKLTCYGYMRGAGAYEWVKNVRVYR